MGTVLSALKKYMALREALPDIVRETVKEHKEEILSMNKQQMKEGKNSLGRPIGKYKNPDYQRMKAGMNPLASGNVDLELTGVFKQGLIIDLTGDRIVINSSGDLKSRALESRYGDVIFGLTDDNKKEFISNTLRPAFIQKIKQFLSK